MLYVPLKSSVVIVQKLLSVSYYGWDIRTLGLYSLSGKTSYRKISWSLEAARFGFKLFQSLWNLAGTSAALLPRCLSNFIAIRPLQHPISWLRDFTRFGGKTSYRLVNRGPGNRRSTCAIMIVTDTLVQNRRQCINNHHVDCVLRTCAVILSYHVICVILWSQQS